MTMINFMKAWTADSCRVHNDYTKKLAYFVLQETQWFMLEVANKMPHYHAENIVSKAPKAMNETIHSLFMEAQHK